jgi:hypothetical protein
MSPWDEVEDDALSAGLGGHWMIMHIVHKDVKPMGGAVVATVNRVRDR